MLRPCFQGACLLLLVGCAAARAQTNLESSASLQFNFAPPGARSLGMGGAFSGLADDATAAFANPAGLVQLTAPEVSLDYRTWSYTTAVPSGCFNCPDYPQYAHLGGRTYEEIDSDARGLAYTSYVHPLGDLVVAVYGHQLSRFEGGLDLPTGAAFVLEGPAGPVLRTTRSRTGSATLDIRSLGATLAYRITERWSVGVTLAGYDYEFFSETNKARGEIYQFAEGDDQALGGSLGVRYSTGKFFVGGVYRYVPAFDARAAYVCDYPAIANPALQCYGQAPDTELHPRWGVGGPTTWDAPDVASLGFGIQPTSQLTLSAEIAHVAYSQMSDDLVNVALIAIGLDESRFAYEDGIEVHLGGEYRIGLGDQRSLFLRAGVWQDPDHSLRFEPEPALADEVDEALEARFGSDADREDEIHLAVGLGFSLGRSFQIDAGADFSDLVDSLSLSGVYRF